MSDNFRLNLSAVSDGAPITAIYRDPQHVLSPDTVRLDYGVDVTVEGWAAAGVPAVDTTPSPEATANHRPPRPYFVNPQSSSHSLMVNFWDSDGSAGCKVVFANGLEMDLFFNTSHSLAEDNFTLQVTAVKRAGEGAAATGVAAGSYYFVLDADNKAYNLCSAGSSDDEQQQQQQNGRPLTFSGSGIDAKEVMRIDPSNN